jgi:hypothetical protein
VQNKQPNYGFTMPWQLGLGFMHQRLKIDKGIWTYGLSRPKRSLVFFGPPKEATGEGHNGPQEAAPDAKANSSRNRATVEMTNRSKSTQSSTSRHDVHKRATRRHGQQDQFPLCSNRCLVWCRMHLRIASKSYARFFRFCPEFRASAAKGGQVYSGLEI